MRILATILLFFAVASLSAQSPDRIRELADRYFEEYSYDRAAKFYEELAVKTTEVQRNLAESYVKMNLPEKAEPYLFDVISGEQFLAEDLFNYSQVLAMNKKYPESVKWMRMYHEQKSGDSRAQAAVEEPEYYVEIQAEESRFEIANLDINTPEEDFGATYFKDQVVFASSRTGVESVVRRWNWNQLAFLDMYIADSITGGQLSEVRRHHKKFNKKFHEGPATFDGEGRTMVYTSNNYKGRSSKGEINLKLFETTFDGEEWGKPEPFPYNDKEYSVGHASLTSDGNTMYFVSDMPGGYGGADIYKTQREEGGEWGKPILLDTKVNTEGNEMFPFIHQDSILFFASDGLLGLGGLDVFLYDMSQNGVPRSKNIKVPVNSSKDDFALIMNDDRTSGYFSSNRDGGKGDDDIYSFTLDKPMMLNKMLKGKVLDQDGDVVVDAKVILLRDGKVIEEVIVDPAGVYMFEVGPGTEYELQAEKGDFSNGTNYVDLENEEVDVVYADLILTKGTTRMVGEVTALDIFADYMHLTDDGLFVDDFTENSEGMSIYTMVNDIATGEPIEDAKVTVVDRRTGREEVFYTAKNGDHTRSLDERKDFMKGDYIVTVEKEGYSTFSYDYSPALARSGQYGNTASLIPDDYIGGTEVADRFQIDNIYFDLDKYDIRPEAAVELDRIVELMNRMPNMIIELTAHTDCRANKRYNKRLSNNRAHASAKYIQDRIDNPQRIYGEGRGELNLANDCACEGDYVSDCPEEEHQENRRTEFRIIKF